MQVPGFLWTALLALIPLLIQWLGGDYFAGQQWVPWAVVALGFIAKLVELYGRGQTPAPAQMREAAPGGAAPASKVWRFLLG